MSIDNEFNGIIQIIPAPPGWFALYGGKDRLPDRSPLKLPIACWALYEADGYKDVRGMIGQRDCTSITWADDCGTFEGYEFDQSSIALKAMVEKPL